MFNYFVTIVVVAVVADVVKGARGL